MVCGDKFDMIQSQFVGVASKMIYC
jgi:hypothetical protein